MSVALMKQSPKAASVGTIGWVKGTSAYKASIRPGLMRWEPPAALGRAVIVNGV